MSLRFILSGMFAAIAAVSFSAIGLAQNAPKPTPVSAPVDAPRTAAPRAMVSGTPLAADKGTFRILLAGAEVGSEQFETQSVGNARVLRSSTVLRAPGQAEMHSSGELRVTAEGALLGYQWNVQAEKKASGSVEYKEGAAKTLIDLNDGKDPYESDFMFASQRIAVLDNNLYSQYALLGQLYDWSVGGQQVLPVLIPQDMTPGTISIESLGPKTVEKDTFDALRVNTADLEIIAYYDARRRLMRVEVPAATVVIVRR